MGREEWMRKGGREEEKERKRGRKVLPSAMELINDCTSAPCSPGDHPPLGIAIVQALFFLVVPPGLSQGDSHMRDFQNITATVILLLII